MLERDRQPTFRVKPAVEDDRYIVVWRNWPEHGDRQYDIVFVFGIALLEYEGIVEENAARDGLKLSLRPISGGLCTRQHQQKESAY